MVLNVFTDSPSRGRARLRVSGGHASTVQPPAVNHPQNSCCDQVGPPSIHTQTFTMLMSVHTTQLTSYSLTYLFNTCLNKSFKDFDTTAAFTQNIGNFTFLPPSIYLHLSLSLSFSIYSTSESVYLCGCSFCIAHLSFYLSSISITLYLSFSDAVFISFSSISRYLAFSVSSCLHLSLAISVFLSQSLTSSLIISSYLCL